MRKNHALRIIALLLVVTLLLPNTMAFAEEEDNGVDDCIEMVADGSIEITSNGITERITFSEGRESDTITVTNLETNEEIFLQKNRITGEIFSSVTGYTELAPVTFCSEDMIDPGSAETEAAKKTYKTYYYSHAEIKAFFGGSVTVAGFVAFLLLRVKDAVLPWDKIADVCTVVGFINLCMYPDSTTSGVKVTVVTTKYYRTRMGQRHIYRTTKSISAVGFY